MYSTTTFCHVSDAATASQHTAQFLKIDITQIFEAWLQDSESPPTSQICSVIQMNEVKQNVVDF